MGAIFEWIKYIETILAFMRLLAELFGSRGEAVRFIRELTRKAKALPRAQARAKFEGLEQTLG